MRIKKTFILLIIIYTVPLNLYSNEKQINSNKNISTSIKSNNNGNTPNLYGIKNDKEDDLAIKYKKRARGLLALGIIGIILSPILLGGDSFLVYCCFIEFNFKKYDLFMAQFLGFLYAETLAVLLSVVVSLHMIIWGFAGYSHYKKKILTDPFIKFNAFNKNLTLGVNINF